jgi:xanthine dehydrogenase accessory factor
VELMNRAADLRRARTPYVMATVVRVERPTSAKPGDRALILGDGTLEGFVGGTCAESTVLLQGLRVLETGRSVLLRIRPGSGGGLGEGGSGGEREGLIVVDNPCLSGGTLDIFLESVTPAPLIHVYGDSPIARALTLVGRAAGYDVVVASAGAAMPADLAAVVVASHGHDEQEALAAAVRAGVPYVVLVASRKRGEAVLAEAGVAREQVHSPAGLDIGAKTPADVAISILAELVLVRATSNAEVAPAGPGVAIDPICQMEVAMTPGAITAERDGQTYYFCGPGCKRAFLS